MTETWRHRKRGTTYIIDGTARFNTSRSLDDPLPDGSKVYICRDVETGHLYVREVAEFVDGRFELVAPIDGEGYK